MTEDNHMGEHEAAVEAAFQLFLQTPRGQELAKEFNDLEIRMGTDKLDGWAAIAICERQDEIMDELYQCDDWVHDDWAHKVQRARTADYLETGIRAGHLVRLDNGRIAHIGDLDRKESKTPDEPSENTKQKQ